MKIDLNKMIRSDFADKIWSFEERHGKPPEVVFVNFERYQELFRAWYEETPKGGFPEDAIIILISPFLWSPPNGLRVKFCGVWVFPKEWWPYAN